MNVPPRISRTPPPIDDELVDGEDEEDGFYNVGVDSIVSCNYSDDKSISNYTNGTLTSKFNGLSRDEDGTSSSCEVSKLELLSKEVNATVYPEVLDTKHEQAQPCQKYIYSISNENIGAKETDNQDLFTGKLENVSKEAVNADNVRNISDPTHNFIDNGDIHIHSIDNGEDSISIIAAPPSYSEGSNELEPTLSEKRDSLVLSGFNEQNDNSSTIIRDPREEEEELHTAGFNPDEHEVEGIRVEWEDEFSVECANETAIYQSDVVVNSDEDESRTGLSDQTEEMPNSISLHSSGVIESELENMILPTTIIFSDVVCDEECEESFNEEPMFVATFPDIAGTNETVEGEDDFCDFTEVDYSSVSNSGKSSDLFSNDFKEFIGSDSACNEKLSSCLKDELLRSILWGQLSQLNCTPALKYNWITSSSKRKLLSTLHIDSRNILSGTWNKKTFKRWLADERVTKVENSGSIKFPEISLPKIPNPHFDWVESGLINPLDDGCSYSKVETTVNVSQSKIFVKSLPDLSFMKQSFIVIPKKCI